MVAIVFGALLGALVVLNVLAALYTFKMRGSAAPAA